jgi:hypothetical protein
MKSFVVFAMMLVAVSAARTLTNHPDQDLRAKCYHECAKADGWAPICAFNPYYCEETTHGGGSSVWPNYCMAQCMVKYHKYVEWDRLDKIKDLTLPEICHKDMWKIYYLDGHHDYDYNQTIIDECNPECALPAPCS